MIPLKIHDKKYLIKSIAELTTGEFIELTNIESIDTLKYVAWQAGINLEDAFFAVSSKSIDQAIGQVPDITKLPRSKKFNYKLLIESVGQRHQIENSGKSGFELLVYCLAVSQARSNNSDDVNKLERFYLTLPFAEILPAGFFFFQKYKPGKRNVLTFLKMLPDLINIVRKKNRPELKN